MNNSVSLQGSLDNLCGIYSVINVYKKLYNPGQIELEKFFAEIIIELDVGTKRLSSIITKGLNSRELTNIFALKCVEEKMIRIPGVKSDSIDDFWKTLKSRSETGDCAILLGLSGIHDHWTVIDKLTNKQMRLLDSDNLHYLNRTNCSIKGYEQEKITHVLHPTQTYFFIKK